ncbi:MAG: peptidoglycan-binding protein [Myxococcales bacterium]|nr:peptidoglycan-binding protein [Myxococcales bacterium]
MNLPLAIAPSLATLVSPLAPLAVRPSGAIPRETVRAVQVELNRLGQSPRLDEDGLDGPNTSAATRAFQQRWNAAGLSPRLDEDGDPGPATLAAARNASAPRFGAASGGGGGGGYTAPSPNATPTALPGDPPRTGNTTASTSTTKMTWGLVIGAGALSLIGLGIGLYQLLGEDDLGPDDPYRAQRPAMPSPRPTAPASAYRATERRPAAYERLPRDRASAPAPAGRRTRTAVQDELPLYARRGY